MNESSLLVIQPVSFQKSKVRNLLLTNDMQEDRVDDGWMGADLTLVVALVCVVHWLYVQLPVNGLDEVDLVAGVVLEDLHVD